MLKFQIYHIHSFEDIIVGSWCLSGSLSLCHRPGSTTRRGTCGIKVSLCVIIKVGLPQSVALTFTNTMTDTFVSLKHAYYNEVYYH